MFVDEASGTYAGHGFEAVTSTIITSTRFDSVVRLINLPSYSSLLWTVGCYYNGGEMGSTGAESKWRQTGWFRKNQIKVRANNYVAPKAYALAA
jgi:hypothetical protein